MPKQPQPQRQQQLTPSSASAAGTDQTVADLRSSIANVAAPKAPSRLDKMTNLGIAPGGLMIFVGWMLGIYGLLSATGLAGRLRLVFVLVGLGLAIVGLISLIRGARQNLWWPDQKSINR